MNISTTIEGIIQTEESNENIVPFGLIGIDMVIIGLLCLVIILCGYFMFLLRRKYKTKQEMNQTQAMTVEMRNVTDTISLEMTEKSKLPSNTPPVLDKAISIQSQSTYIPSDELQIVSPTKSNISILNGNDGNEMTEFDLNRNYEISLKERSITDIKRNGLLQKISASEYDAADNDNDNNDELRNINPLSMAGSLERVLPFTSNGLNVNPLAVDVDIVYNVSSDLSKTNLSKTNRSETIGSKSKQISNMLSVNIKEQWGLHSNAASVDILEIMTSNGGTPSINCSEGVEANICRYLSEGQAQQTHDGQNDAQYTNVTDIGDV